MFYIRTDANPIIATGHVMRCMSIAKEINKLGQEVTFITADMQAQDLIERNGFSILCLDSKWDDLEKELMDLIQLIKNRKIDQLLIDSYYVTEYYLMKLHKHTKVLYIDDLGSIAYPVDVLINYNNYADCLGYSELYRNTQTRLLLGCAYIPLREEFQDIQVSPSEKVEKILLTTGGADNYHVAREFLQYFTDHYLGQPVEADILRNGENQNNKVKLLRSVEFHIVLGKFNTDKKELEKMARTYPNINLHTNVTDMSKLMKQCDLAIAAGGSTMYELCACGLPMITYAFADNQLPGVKGFERLQLARYCGDFRTDGDALWLKIIEAIYEYSQNHEYRVKVSTQMKLLVDGYGANRLANILVRGIYD